MNRHFQTSGLVNRKLIDNGNTDRLRNEAGLYLSQCALANSAGLTCCNTWNPSQLKFRADAPVPDHPRATNRGAISAASPANNKVGFQSNIYCNVHHTSASPPSHSTT